MNSIDAYYYNATIRKTVAIFGSVFNNIYTGKMLSGKLTNVTRVPLSYGPRERFLVRMRTADNKSNADVAVKLPRMSFEITSISADTAAILNKNNFTRIPIAGTTNEVLKIRQAVPYIIGMQLTILADNQDSGLQIVEQIIPNFIPDYTLSVKDMEGPGTLTDVPITLQDVELSDDYEGDFESSRRSIIYTLNFAIKVKFVGDTTHRSKIIKIVSIDLNNSMSCDDLVPSEHIDVRLGDLVNDTPENHTVITTFGFD